MRIATLAIGQGARAAVQAQIRSLGANTLTVIPGTVTSGGARMGMGGNTTLTPDDAAAIRAECPAVAAVAPSTEHSARDAGLDHGVDLLVERIADAGHMLHHDQPAAVAARTAPFSCAVGSTSNGGAASPTGPTSIALAWSQSTDDVGVAGYRVSRDITAQCSARRVRNVIASQGDSPRCRARPGSFGATASA
mgnify:CR=1 FL=1